MEGSRAIQEKLIPYIVAKFQLFEGKRSPDEDKEILDKVLAHCFYELLIIISENLPAAEPEKMKREIEEAGKNTDDSQVILKILENYLQKSKLNNEQVLKRLSEKIDLLLENALRKKRNAK